MKRSISILSAIFVVQVVIRQFDLHFANPYVDRAIYYTPVLTLSVVLLLIAFLLRRKWSHKLAKPVSTTFLVLIIPICGGLFLFSAVHVAESGIDAEKRMYLTSVNDWQYYAHTLRRSALDHLAVDVLKERNLGYGLSIRKIVSANELNDVGVSPDSVNSQYFRFYFGKEKL